MRNLRCLLLFVFVLTALCVSHAQQLQPISLWPGGAPGAKAGVGEETVRVYEPTGDHIVSKRSSFVINC